MRFQVSDVVEFNDTYRQETDFARSNRLDGIIWKVVKYVEIDPPGCKFKDSQWLSLEFFEKESSQLYISLAPLNRIPDEWKGRPYIWPERWFELKP